MTILLKLATKMLAVLSIFAMIALPAAAQGLSASDMAFAFGGAAKSEVAHNSAPIELASARGMTYAEMDETEGAVLPWVIRGAVMGTIGAVGNAANTWNNGGRGWAVVRAGGIGFAVGATGGVASKWLGNRRW
jgi:hypothetical protein